MAELLDHIEYLSKEIGPRPAGTEEEQQAALYIADQLQQEAGFHAEIEEFTSSSNLEGARAIPSVIIVVVTVLAMIFNAFTIPALILTLIAAAVYALEAFDCNVVSKMLARGASQNVVAKYQPNGEKTPGGRRGRSRKVVLVAHYDTGKVKPAVVSKIDSTGLPIGMICIAAMAVTAFLLLVRIFVGGAGGPAAVILNVLTIIALIIVALPIVKAVLYRVAPYNEGANNNATGTAALIEIARRISQGSVSEAELSEVGEIASYMSDPVMLSQSVVVDDGVTIHGEEAALASGLVPEGVAITYETQQPVREMEQAALATELVEAYDERDERERLLAAKAAIAALTGRPVVQEVYVEEFVQEEPPTTLYDSEQYNATSAQPIAVETPVFEAPKTEIVEEEPQSAPSAVALQAAQQTSTVAGFQNAPSWFVAAQQNAKKSTTAPTESQRSRYNQAIETAERERAKREEERIQEQRDQEGAALAALEVSKEIEGDIAIPAVDPQVAEPKALEALEGEAVQDTPVVEAALNEPAPVIADAEGTVGETSAEEIEQEKQVESEAGEPEVDLGQTIAWQPIVFNSEEVVEIENEEEPAKGPQLDLPSIEAAPEEPAQESVPETESPSRSGLMRKLRTDIPSLSGVIKTQQEETNVPGTVKRAAVSVPSIDLPEISAGNGGNASIAGKAADIDYDMDLSSLDVASIAPLSQEETAPSNGAGQVEMPSSRAEGFMDRRRKKKEDLSETPQEWLDVDANFDARTVGRERGSWESFRENADQSSSSSKSSRKWEGGAFSRIRLGHVDTRSGADTTSDQVEEMVESDEDRILNEEIGQIIHFRNPDYNTEVWFVAVGSDTELHDGAKAFIDAHADELRGSMIIEIESLGAGALSYATEEGQFRKTAASSRVKRYVRPASEACGIALDGVKLNGSESVTTTMQKAGYQAMHLFGAEAGEPALKGSADDVFENVEELTLEENVAFLMELLKHN